jgi:hypothetical protein
MLARSYALSPTGTMQHCKLRWFKWCAVVKTHVAREVEEQGVSWPASRRQKHWQKVTAVCQLMQGIQTCHGYCDPICSLTNVVIVQLKPPADTWRPPHALHTITYNATRQQLLNSSRREYLYVYSSCKQHRISISACSPACCSPCSA